MMQPQKTVRFSGFHVSFYLIDENSPYAVRKAYKLKALETHPDKLEPTATEHERRSAEGKFRNV